MTDRTPLDERTIDLRLQSILARFPDRYDDAQITLISKHIAETVDAARALRAVPLTNADEPAATFLPYRAD